MDTWLPAIVQGALVIFGAGLLAGRMTSLEKRFDALEQRVNKMFNGVK